MYLDFYGLTAKPFSIVPNPELFYPSAKHKMALTYLEYGLTQGESFILLTGEIGAGKTTLIRRLLDNLDADVDVAVIFNTNIGGDVLVKMVLQEFEVEGVAEDKSVNLDLLNTYLLRNFERGIRSLIIVDEAQNLSREALEEVRMLSNLHTRDHNLVQIILAGQPELRDRMRDPALAQLAQRIAVTYHLGPLTRDEMTEYVDHRLREAGRDEPGPFTPEGLDVIYEHARGIPRVINILCDTSLVYGYADEALAIGPETVRGVLNDREETGVDLGVGGEILNLPLENVLPQGGPAMADPALHGRLAVLESRVARLDEIVSSQMRELTADAEKQRDRVVAALQELLAQERTRNAKLMRALVAYQKRVRQMQTQGSASEQAGEAEGRVEPLPEVLAEGEGQPQVPADLAEGRAEPFSTPAWESGDAGLDSAEALPESSSGHAPADFLAEAKADEGEEEEGGSERGSFFGIFGRR